jgi:hypothetical protein
MEKFLKNVNKNIDLNKHQNAMAGAIMNIYRAEHIPYGIKQKM